jgi:hypothetical protein
LYVGHYFISESIKSGHALRSGLGWGKKEKIIPLFLFCFQCFGNGYSTHAEFCVGGDPSSVDEILAAGFDPLPSVSVDNGGRRRRRRRAKSSERPTNFLDHFCWFFCFCGRVIFLRFCVFFFAVVVCFVSRF